MCSFTADILICVEPNTYIPPMRLNCQVKSRRVTSASVMCIGHCRHVYRPICLQWRTQDFRMGGVQVPQAPRGGEEVSLGLAVSLLLAGAPCAGYWVTAQGCDCRLGGDLNSSIAG